MEEARQYSVVMQSDSYPISPETERYVASSIENNKFAIVFSGAPFLSVFLFNVLNENELSTLVKCAGFVSAVCLLVTLLYSMFRLVHLHRYRAIILSKMALQSDGERGMIEIQRSNALLSGLPGVALVIGYVSLFASLALELLT